MFSSALSRPPVLVAQAKVPIGADVIVNFLFPNELDFPTLPQDNRGSNDFRAKPEENNVSGGRTRGRPLSFDREAALDRVLPIFWRKGFASASLDELAAAAGLNRPNLAAAFGDKRGLYLATLERFKVQFADEAGRIFNQPSTLRNCLDRFFDFAVTVYTRHGLGCFIVGTAPAASGDDSEIQESLAAGLETIRSALQQRVSAAVGVDLSPSADAEGIAISLTGVLLTLALYARAGSAPSDLFKMHRRACGALLTGSTSIGLQSESQGA
jgi:AcrR family transcriptional regulator